MINGRDRTDTWPKRIVGLDGNKNLFAFYRLETCL